MIGILIITHGQLGTSLIDCATHVLGKKPTQLDCFVICHDTDPDIQLPKAQAKLDALDTGDGVLILSDIYGATPCNMVTKLFNKPQVCAVAGVNLTMLLGVLNYQKQPLKDCVQIALDSGRNGIVHFTKNHCEYAS